MTFTESTIEQAAIDGKAVKVFTANLRHVGRESLAYRGASQSTKPLGSGSHTLARLRDGLSLPRVMRGEVRVKNLEV